MKENTPRGNTSGCYRGLCLGIEVGSEGVLVVASYGWESEVAFHCTVS